MDKYLSLKKKRTKRRIIETILTVLSLVAVIVFTTLKQSTKHVTKIVVSQYLSYDRFSYSADYDIAIMITGLIFAFCIAILISDLLVSRVYYKQIDGQDVIVYNGLGFVRLLVDGKEVDVMFMKGYAQTKLKSGVTIVVSPQFFMSYHLTFSDNRDPIDL